MAAYSNLPYYAEKDWTDVFWGEAGSAVSYQYAPFVTWENVPFNGQTITVGPEGRRVTPGAECEADAFDVFVFGGSSMWGYGSPDWGTIPAYLQARLDTTVERPVCVTNFGTDGYVSTQEVILLIKQLQCENIPDAVIFYDGLNDVYAGYESGRPGTHTMLPAMREKLEDPPQLAFAKRTRLFQLIAPLTANVKGAPMRMPQEDREQLSAGISAAYLANYRAVRALAEDYGFQYFFFWQPDIAVGGKPLTAEEQAMRSKMGDDLIQLTRAVYELIEAEVDDYENLWYIADVLDPMETQIWIDEWSHVTPSGNELVAERMLDLIADRLAVNR